MGMLDKLQEQGWYLTEEGLKKLTTNNAQADDVNKIISLALNYDLKEIAAGALPSKPDNTGTIPGRIVLQIQKLRNISAPKSNEESVAASRFLQLELSDGVNSISALEFERIANLNLNVPPGTKIFFKSEKLQYLNGYLVLKASDINILGGRVEGLVEKWELARQMLKYAKSNRRLSGSGGPPPWIAFGKRLDGLKDALPTDRSFKSLETANEKEKSSKENEEFNASRSQAIAEAAKAGQKKVFGGGQQNIIDHNVKKILEKGYTEEEAKQALKTTNNNLERSLYNLKRKNSSRGGLSENATKPTSASRTRDRGGIVSAKEAAVTKPQTNVSLFDFLTDKLPGAVPSEAILNNTNNNVFIKNENSVKPFNSKAGTTASNRFENNLSSTFAANRSTVAKQLEDRPNTQSRSNTLHKKQEESYQQYGNKNGKGGERNNSSKTKTPISNYNKINEGNVNLMLGNNNKRNAKPLKKEREPMNRQSNSDYHKQPNDYNRSTEKKFYQTRDNNRNQDARSTTTNQKSINLEKTLDDLVDNTSKLAIQSKKELACNSLSAKSHQQSFRVKNHQISSHEQLEKSEKYGNNSQRISSKSLQQNTNLAANSLQLRNGFAYDPSKITGFQSKEANEYAMYMLKSQGVIMQQLQQQQSASKQLTPLTPPLTQQIHHQAPLINNQATGTFMAQNANIFVTPPQRTSSQFGMMPSDNWPWKEGDFCFAKYWDDGNYYNAKITAISDKTCVVLFLEYGNHEEVLKSDCIPITDTQHFPLNTYNTNITHSSITQQSPPAIQQRTNMNSATGNVGSQRYKSERQMYVPPPKRNNN